jgi:8-oxo-dGTP diphosphatase
VSTANHARIRVVCALIERAGCVLAAQRAASQSRPGAWELPGGKIDGDESVATAIVREITEELDCTVRPVEVLRPHTHVYPDVTVTLLPLRCEIVAGDPRPLEHAQIRWVRIDDLASLDWSAADVAVIDDYVKAAAARSR